MTPDELVKRYTELGETMRDMEKSKWESEARISKLFSDMKKIADESSRVADVAHNAPRILEELDREFEAKTELDTFDMAFLFLATALQCIRWYVLSNEKFRFANAREGDQFMKKIVPKTYQDILLAPVPYDAYGPRGLNTGLGGTTHRYRTLGHDPIMGWIFGPLNILSDSLTKNAPQPFTVESFSVQNMVIVEPMSTLDVLDNGIA